MQVRKADYVLRDEKGEDENAFRENMLIVESVPALKLHTRVNRILSCMIVWKRGVYHFGTSREEIHAAL